jgi:cation diffusion facilitator family transporter
MGDNSTLYRDSRRASARTVALALGLGLIKALAGVFGHSLALLSDAVHSLVDGAIAAASLAALYLAERPADREHPYGHGRAESVAGAGVALLLMVLSTGIAWEALTTLGARGPAPSVHTLAIAAGCALCQEAMYRHSSRVARRTGSGALLATAWDNRLDALGSLAVVIGVALSKWGGPSWHWADHVAAVVVAGTVLWIGGALLRDNVDSLMDRQASPERLAAVRREALAVPEVREVETLRIRKVGLEQLVDIHIEVEPELTVAEGHAIAHAVKDRLIRQIGAIRDVLVHVEPYRNDG